MQYIKDKLPFVISLLFCTGLILYAYGCEPKTRSLIDPKHKITSIELETEFKILLLEHEARTADIDRQNEIRKLIFEQGLLIAESGGVNPVGLITSLLAVLGVGATIDDVRLRKIIKKQ